jgi:hypothetical protein
MAHTHLCALLRLADIISTVEFDSTGNYLATGDKGGRVVLFERNESVSISFFHFPCLPSAVNLIVSLIVHFLWRALHPSIAFLRVIPSIQSRLRQNTEKRLRVQILHRVPVTRTRVRLSQVAGNRGEDQQDQMVQTTKLCTLSAIHKRYHLFIHRFMSHSVLIPAPRQDDQTLESFRKIITSGIRIQSP